MQKKNTQLTEPPSLPNQSLPNQSLPNQAFQTKPSKPSLPNQAFQTKPSKKYQKQDKASKNPKTKNAMNNQQKETKVITLPKLNSDDYHLWAVQATSTFVVRKVWSIVDGSEPSPIDIV